MTYLLIVLKIALPAYLLGCRAPVSALICALALASAGKRPLI